MYECACLHVCWGFCLFYSIFVVSLLLYSPFYFILFFILLTFLLIFCIIMYPSCYLHYYLDQNCTIIHILCPVFLSELLVYSISFFITNLKYSFFLLLYLLQHNIFLSFNSWKSIINSGACHSIWFNTGNLIRPGHQRKWQIESWFLHYSCTTLL